jgi:competence protein ComEC
MADAPQARRWGSAIARRPAAATAGLFIAGILLHAVLPAAPPLWIALAASLCVLAVLLRRHPTTAAALIAASVVLTGACAAQLDAFYFPQNGIGSFAGEQPRLANLEMRIIQPPRLLTGAFSQYRALPPKQITTARVTRIRTWRGWEDSCGDILVQITQPHARLALGQTVRALGMLERPGPAMNPGQFNWADYYREQRILTSLQIAHADNIQILDPGRIGPISWLRLKTREALAAGFPADRALDHALLRALVLGDSDPELRDVQEQFRRTGTSHHLAISGMHIAILGGVVFGICRVLRVGPRAACWISLTCVVLYGIVALPSPPVVRSVLLCVSFAVGILWRRSVDLIQLLALSVLAMLIYHPLDLFNAGFQLSFGTVLGLALFTKPLMPLLGAADIDRQIAVALNRSSCFSLLRMKLGQAGRAALAAAIVAWIVSMPLIALHFEQLNPWAVLASILLAPVVFLALVGGFLKILLTLLWPGAASIWASLAAAPVAGMRHTVDWLATFPRADVPMPAPPIWIIILFYLLLLIPLLHWPRPTLRWPASILAVAGCIVLSVIPLGASLAEAPARGGGAAITITLLAVGAGQCAVIEPARGDPVVIDAGSATLSDLLRKCLGPFLRHQGRQRIEQILITHANFDHFGSVGEVAAAYDVSAVRSAPQFVAQSVGNPPAENLLKTLDAFERSPLSLCRGEQLDLGGGIVAQVLWPPRDSQLDPNNSSLVIKLMFGGRSVLFTGDIQSPAMRELMAIPADLRADVLVAPHHGSGEEATESFVQAVDPQYILSSNDRTLSMKQRDFDRMIGARAHYRTHTSGAIRILIDSQGKLDVTTFLPAPDPAPPK